MVQNEKIRPQAPAQTHRLNSPLFRAIARDLLRAGTSVCFEAKGSSMLPAIQDGDVLHVAPVGASQLRCGEILLVEGDGSTEDTRKLWVHRLISKDIRGDRFVTQGDASQEPDAPVRAHQIFGRVIAKESVIQRVMVKAVKTEELTMNGI